LTFPLVMCTIVINSTWRLTCAPAHSKCPTLMFTLPKPLPALPNFPRGKRIVSTRNCCHGHYLRLLKPAPLPLKKFEKGNASKLQANNYWRGPHAHRPCINIHNLHNHIRPFVASTPCCQAIYHQNNSPKKSRLCTHNPTDP